MYFTFIHYIWFFICLGIFSGFFWLVKKKFLDRDGNLSVFYTLLICGFLGLILLCFVGASTIEGYTKKAKISNFTTEHIFNTESLKLRGRVANIGAFKLVKVQLEVHFKNSSLHDTSGQNFFKPRSFTDMLADLTSPKKSKDVVIYRVTIGKNIKPKSFRNFIKTVPYPPGFVRPLITYKVIAH